MLKSFRVDGWRGVTLLTLVLACVGIQALAPASFALLRYQRGAIAAGEWWRLLSAHVTHLTNAHLLVNMAGLVLVWALVIDELTPRRWLAAMAVVLIGIDAGLWWLSPAIDWYVGASGALHGMLAAGLVCALWRGDLVARIGLPILVLKLLLEQRGGTLGITHGLPVISVAHVYGAVAGAAAGALLHTRRTPRPPAAPAAHAPPACR